MLSDFMGKETVVYRTEVIEWLKETAKSLQNPDAKTIDFLGIGELNSYSPNDLLANIINKTPLGVRLYNGAETLYNNLPKK